MNCVCGHPENDHVRGGRCRVLDCPCELFRPGDTLGHGRFGKVASRPRVSAWALGAPLASLDTPIRREHEIAG